jgi:hypothetical protein
MGFGEKRRRNRRYKCPGERYQGGAEHGCESKRHTACQQGQGPFESHLHLLAAEGIYTTVWTLAPGSHACVQPMKL